MRPAVRGGALCLLLALLCAPWALADIPQSPAEAFYVNDFANVIDASDEERMLALGAALEDETTAQAVVVTVDFLDGMTIEDYAYELFNLWGIGQEDANNGVLLLLSLGEREIRAEIGEGLEEKLTPSRGDAHRGRLCHGCAARGRLFHRPAGRLRGAVRAAGLDIRREPGRRGAGIRRLIRGGRRLCCWLSI